VQGGHIFNIPCACKTKIKAKLETDLKTKRENKVCWSSAVPTYEPPLNCKPQ